MAWYILEHQVGRRRGGGETEKAREREREREQVRTDFVLAHRIQELIQVAENSEINEIIAILSNQMQLSRERIAQCEVFLVPFNS